MDIPIEEYCEDIIPITWSDEWRDVDGPVQYGILCGTTKEGIKLYKAWAVAGGGCNREFSSALYEDVETTDIPLLIITGDGGIKEMDADLVRQLPWFGPPTTFADMALRCERLHNQAMAAYIEWSRLQ
jgi:hypothetical protein